MNTQIYPERFEEKIGFDRIRDILKDRCYSTLGKGVIDGIHFQSNHKEVDFQLNQAEEFRQILLSPDAFPGSNYFDPTRIFEQLRPRGSYVEAESLAFIRRSLETIIKIKDFLRQNNDSGALKYPSLAKHTENLDFDHSWPLQIMAIVDDHSEIRDTASPELSVIRKEMRSLKTKAERRLMAIMSEGKQQGWIQNDVELVLRNGRQVIPIPVANKRKIRGFVHDHSSSGQTAYLEPEEIFELNNSLRDFQAAERQEIVRILTNFADKLRPNIPDLERAYQMMGIMDANRSKAFLALDMDAAKPRLLDKPHMDWINARHPLLHLSFKAQGKEVVPLQITLNHESRILIISGPNAGGKSVCLKTCGLAQYMLQCGLLPPMETNSEAGIFEELFIDIGDEQSLDNDLSTYSSHLVNMRHLLDNAGTGTLFLIDEFGTGTEPRIGGAIAEAILDSLHEKMALGVITTHYANLKLMAGKYPGIQNGSMLFDTKQLKPLFRLATGSPGSSFAFEIAKTIGLPENILSKAATLAGDVDLDFDVQLQDMEVKKAELEARENQLRRADDFLSEIIEKYQALNSKLEERKSQILLDARREAKNILSGTNRMIEKTIRDIKEAGAEREATRLARQELQQFTQGQGKALEEMSNKNEPSETKKEKRRKKQPQPEKDQGPILSGDWVRMTGQQTPGEVVSFSGKKALVEFGSVRLHIPLDQLEKLKKNTIKKQIKSGSSHMLSFDINEKAAAFSPDLDLRGKRLEEATKILQYHIDDANLLGIHLARIIHGKGDGILRKHIREYLRDVPQVRKYEDEHADRGGAGITIVHFG